MVLTNNINGLKSSISNSNTGLDLNYNLDIFDMYKYVSKLLVCLIVFILLVSFVSISFGADNLTNNLTSNLSSSLNDSLKNNISLELLSNKKIYSVGESVNLTLRLENNYDVPINGQLRGKIIIGDVGYEIQCFDYLAKENNTAYLGLSPLPASMSNSNRKTMTTLYACSGTQMQSTKTIIDNSPINQIGSENFSLGPFIYSYTYNGTDYEVKSNVLNITVTTNNQQNSQNQQNQQNSQNQQSQQNQQNSNNKNSNSQNNNGAQNGKNEAQNNGQNSQSKQGNGQGNNLNPSSKTSGLTSKQSQALNQNQQNSQSINQLKKDIAKAKLNPFNNAENNEEYFWYWFLLLIIIIGISIYLFNKYFKKEVEDVKFEEIKEVEPKIPRYIELLNSIDGGNSNKENAKILSQSIRSYIANENDLDDDLTYKKSIDLTNDVLFKDLLKKCELIEFAGKNIKLDYNKIVKDLKKKMNSN